MFGTWSPEVHLAWSAIGALLMVMSAVFGFGCAVTAYPKNSESNVKSARAYFDAGICTFCAGGVMTLIALFAVNKDPEQQLQYGLAYLVSTVATFLSVGATIFIRRVYEPKRKRQHEAWHQQHETKE